MKFVVYRGIIYKNRSQKITYRIKLKKLYKCSFSKINIIHVIRNSYIFFFIFQWYNTIFKAPFLQSGLFYDLLRSLIPPFLLGLFC